MVSKRNMLCAGQCRCGCCKVGQPQFFYRKNRRYGEPMSEALQKLHTLVVRVVTITLGQEGALFARRWER
jgi:hypothetical protein